MRMNLWLSGGGRTAGRDRKETGMYVYLLLYLKWMVNKHLRYSRETVQCYAVTWMGGESGEEWIRV